MVELRSDEASQSGPVRPGLVNLHRNVRNATIGEVLQGMREFYDILKEWSPDRGFGFIHPSDRGLFVFVHISGLEVEADELRIGDRLEYEIGTRPRWPIPSCQGSVGGLMTVEAPLIVWKDELPPAAPKPTCFLCESVIPGKGDGRFCNSLCRRAYDSGYVHRKPGPVKYRWELSPDRKGEIMEVMGDGFAIQCFGCRKTFSSKGLRCCSQAVNETT